MTGLPRSMKSFAIVPAAGRSARMGQPKLLLRWGPRSLIEQVLAAWRASRVDHLVVVVHPDDARLASLCRQRHVEVIVPSIAPPEMKNSVQEALDYIGRQHDPAPSDAWLVAPADMPYLSPVAINAVLDAAARENAQVVVPEFNGQRGHPALFRYSLAGEVEQLAADEGVDVLLQRHTPLVVRCPNLLTPADIDSVSDYRRLRDR